METIQKAGSAVVDREDSKSAKRRRYVAFQAIGWGLFFLVHLYVLLQVQWPNLKPDSYLKLHPVEYVIGRLISPVAVGFLLTHFTRRFLTSWSWKYPDWRSLMPRILATSAVLSLAFNVLVGIVGYRLLHIPELKPKAASYFLVNCISGLVLFDVWLGAYFFYHLFERLNRSENERLSLVVSQKEAELRALKSQVNPHFIFNSLNSLRSLIEEEPKRARVAATQLANLLRYSLDAAQLETVPLEEELRIAHDYLALEQVRYEDRLSLRIDVSPEALALAVPSMILQTLVENAVKYGIGQRRKGGEIAIIACCDGDVLRLQVTNPSAPDAPSKISSNSTGVGLRNAAHRLRLLFGERATLRLRTDIPDLVIAEVVVPLKPFSV